MTEVRTRKKQGQPEFELACAIAGLLRRTAKPGVFWTAIENGERRPVVAVERCKRKGVRNGLPDLLCLASGQLIALELKTERNKLRGTQKGRVSPDQIAVKEMIEAAGGVYEVAFGYDHAVKFLTEWGVLRPDQSLIRHQEPAPRPKELV